MFVACVLTVITARLRTVRSTAPVTRSGSSLLSLIFLATISLVWGKCNSADFARKTSMGLFCSQVLSWQRCSKWRLPFTREVTPDHAFPPSAFDFNKQLLTSALHPLHRQ